MREMDPLWMPAQQVSSSIWTGGWPRGSNDGGVLFTLSIELDIPSGDVRSFDALYVRLEGSRRRRVDVFVTGSRSRSSPPFAARPCWSSWEHSRCRDSRCVGCAAGAREDRHGHGVSSSIRRKCCVRARGHPLTTGLVGDDDVVAQYVFAQKGGLLPVHVLANQVDERDDPRGSRTRLACTGYPEARRRADRVLSCALPS